VSHSKSALCLLLLLVAGSFGMGQVPQGSYTSWVTSTKARRLIGARPLDEKLELAITIVTGDDASQGEQAVLSTFAVTSGGQLSELRLSPSAIQGGGPSQLSPGDFSRLHSLAGMLPGDGGRLPPRGRRLMVESQEPSGSIVRVYDRSNLPDGVLEMLRLVGADAWAIFDFPQIQSDERWKKGHPPTTVSEPESFALAEFDTRLLAVSNDRSLLVVEHNPSGWWEPAAQINPEGQKREPPFVQGEWSTLSIHQRQSGAALYEAQEPLDGRRWVYAYSARFTPDDHYLLVLTNLPAVQIYDTRSWRLLKQLAGLPAGAIAYYPSSDWKWGVAVFPSGEVSLWDKERERSLARIDLGGELQRVAFSPDDSRVAVVTLDQDQSMNHLRVWNRTDGKLVSELRPLERKRGGIGQPVWSHDGKYLMASCPLIVGTTSTVVAVWEVDARRYRGALSICEFPDVPATQIVLDGSRLFKTCGSDEALMWNVDAAIQKVEAFYKSLETDH
jgi:hypothetical protein